MLKKIFSIENNMQYKQLTLLGMKFKFFSAKLGIKMLERELSAVSNKLTELQKTPKFLYKLNPLEEYFPKGFYQDFCNKDLTQRYTNLTRGLDDKSRIVIDKALYRIQQYAKNGQTVFHLDKKEYEEMSKVMQDASEPIVLSDGVYGLGGYSLAGNLNCGGTVFYKHFINEVVDKKKILENDIIDAGAYIGDSALVLSEYTNGKIHCFEPETSNFENLKKTIEINNLENVKPIKLGLGGETRDENIISEKSFSVGASFNKDSISVDNLSKEKVTITTIDKYVEENNIKVGLIKTDVEGFEQELLRGAINTIKRDKPILMISIYHTFDDFWDIKPMIESLDLGYTFTIRKPAFPDFCGDIVLNAEVPAEESYMLNKEVK